MIKLILQVRKLLLVINFASETSNLFYLLSLYSIGDTCNRWVTVTHTTITLFKRFLHSHYYMEIYSFCMNTRFKLS